MKRNGFVVLAVSWLAAHADGAVTVRIGQNFQGATYGVASSAQPADGDGAAGPTHFVEFVNGRFTVYAKSDGSVVQTISDRSFWTTAGITFGSSLQVTDPRIVFDTYSQRWFASQVDFNPRQQLNNRFLLAVSATADPSGAWNAFAFAADPVNGYFADFPTLGVDPDGVFLAGDMFDASGSSVGPLLVSIPKTGLLASPPTIDGRTSFGVLSYTGYGDIVEPAMTTGSPSTSEFVLAAGDLGLDLANHTTLIAAIVQNVGMTNGATLSSGITVTVPPYTAPINPPQPDGSNNLDDGDARIGACIRRVGDIVYAVHATEINSRAAIAWYTLSATNSSLLQSGNISDPNLHLFYPSIAANGNGVVVIGFNGCSSNTFVSSYAVLGETINGSLSFGNPILLKSGTASYQSPDQTGASRWGDYSATTVDPSDPTRFWTLQMVARSQNSWTTQITELITSQTESNNSPLQLAIMQSGTNVMISWPSTATGVQLQASDSLTAPDWTPIAQQPTVTNDQATVTLPFTNSVAFFRLATNAPALQ